MQQPQTSAAHQSYHQVGNTMHSGLFTPRRVSLIAAGAFLFVLVLLVVAGRHASSNQLHAQLDTGHMSGAAASIDNTSAPPGPDASATGTDPPPGDKATNSTHVEVNGQTIPIPANGSTSNTTTTGNSSSTTVNVSHHSTQSSSGTSTSSSQNLNVTVNSSSHSSGSSASSN